MTSHVGAEKNHAVPCFFDSRVVVTYIKLSGVKMVEERRTERQSDLEQTQENKLSGGLLSLSI